MTERQRKEMQRRRWYTLQRRARKYRDSKGYPMWSHDEMFVFMERVVMWKTGMSNDVLFGLVRMYASELLD